VRSFPAAMNRGRAEADAARLKGSTHRDTENRACCPDTQTIDSRYLRPGQDGSVDSFRTYDPYSTTFRSRCVIGSSMALAMRWFLRARIDSCTIGSAEASKTTRRMETQRVIAAIGCCADVRSPS
jgi:hypothetical protein